MTDFSKIDKYQVVEQIGEGSFGTVFKGRDPDLKRDVAIKVCTLADIGLRKRFFREAEIAGNLQHKNIVTVFAFGFEGEVPYLVQEYLPGKDLQQLIEEGTAVPTVDKLDYLLQVASGLEYAHGEGVVHRDIKPANVRLLDGGVVKIMDFGIAKLAGAETQLTQQGVAMGTATYLPPEQVRGGDVDHRADLFSLGVLAYELLTLKRPFRGNTVQALIYQILYKPPVPIKNAWSVCPEPLARIVERCLEKDPDRRYPGAEALIPALQAVRDRVAGGEWPAARKPPTRSRVAVPAPVTPPPAAPSADELGARTLRIPAVEVPPEKDDESTQPIPVIAAGQTATGSLAAGSPAAGSPSAETPALTTTAEEIQQLVAQGELEEAQRRLQSTIARQKAVKMPPPVPAPAAPAGLTPPAAEELTVPLPTTRGRRRSAKAPPAAGATAAGMPAAGTPAAGTPAAGTPAAGTPAAGDRDLARPTAAGSTAADRQPLVHAQPGGTPAGDKGAGAVARLRSMLPPGWKKWGLAVAAGGLALVLVVALVRPWSPHRRRRQPWR